MECYSTIKSETMPLSATGMDLEVTILSKVGKRKKSSTHHLHVEPTKKKDVNKFIYKTESDSRVSETNLWFPKEKDVGKDKLGVGINICILLNIK